MPRTLTDTGQRILGDLPAFLQSDPIVLASIDAGATELDRIRDFLIALRTSYFPPTADDTYGFLSMWEATLGLPVAPSGLTLDTRRGLVIGHLRNRHAGEGSAWEEALAKVLENVSYRYIEGPGDYQITVTVPYTSGSLAALRLQELIQEITPAHLQVTVAYEQGFLIGISLVGDKI